jgi:hypothetical protein
MVIYGCRMYILEFHYTKDANIMETLHLIGHLGGQLGPWLYIKEIEYFIDWKMEALKKVTLSYTWQYHVYKLISSQK